MKRVVVYCSDTSLGLIRSLGEAGYRPECYCYGKECSILLASRYISIGKSFETPLQVIDYLIYEYPTYDEKPVLFTLPDKPAYYVDIHYDILKKKFVLMSCGKEGGIVYWMDKLKINSLAEKYGLTIPWMIKLDKTEDIPENITYPVFTKSIRTVDGGKCDESICNSKAELEVRKSTMTSESFLVMKYIKKKKEIDFFGISIGNRVYIDFYDEISRFAPDAYGYYSSFHICERDLLYHKMVDMMRETKYEGMFDVEFLLGEDGILYFMEVNFRVDGAIYKLCEGINHPAQWCRLSSMDRNALPDRLTVKRKEFVGISELQDYRDSVVTGQVSLLRWIWEFITADRRMMFNMKDPYPAILKTVRGVKNRIHSYLIGKLWQN